MGRGPVLVFPRSRLDSVLLSRASTLSEADSARRAGGAEAAGAGCRRRRGGAAGRGLGSGAEHAGEGLFEAALDVLFSGGGRRPGGAAAAAGGNGGGTARGGAITGRGGASPSTSASTSPKMSCEVSFCSGAGGAAAGPPPAGEQGLAGGEDDLLVGEGLGEPAVRCRRDRRRSRVSSASTPGPPARREKEKVSTSNPGASVPAITRSGALGRRRLERLVDPSAPPAPSIPPRPGPR